MARRPLRGGRGGAVGSGGRRPCRRPRALNNSEWRVDLAVTYGRSGLGLLAWSSWLRTTSDGAAVPGKGLMELFGCLLIARPARPGQARPGRGLGAPGGQHRGRCPRMDVKLPLLNRSPRLGGPIQPRQASDKKDVSHGENASTWVVLSEGLWRDQVGSHGCDE